MADRGCSSSTNSPENTGETEPASRKRPPGIIRSCCSSKKPRAAVEHQQNYQSQQEREQLQPQQQFQSQLQQPSHQEQLQPPPQQYAELSVPSLLSFASLLLEQVKKRN
ncbi:hypothetical protein Pelo_8863 [Pelomyxa schiedti]|nr:hypothetical protein Pelo_8863 [Pelomyxa schiedti]